MVVTRWLPSRYRPCRPRG